MMVPGLSLLQGTGPRLPISEKSKSCKQGSSKGGRESKGADRATDLSSVMKSVQEAEGGRFHCVGESWDTISSSDKRSDQNRNVSVKGIQRKAQTNTCFPPWDDFVDLQLRS